MKKVFLPGMVAAAMSLGLTGNSVFGQSVGYQQGLAVSSFPAPTTASSVGQPVFYTASTSVGTGVQTRTAQVNPNNVGGNHVHIPPGNYSFGESVNGQAQSTLPAPNPQQINSTVQASGTSDHYAPVPQPQPQSLPHSYGYEGGYTLQESGSGCSTCGVGQPGYGMAPSYSAVPTFGFGAAHGCAPAATVAVPTVVSPRPWIFGSNALLFKRIDDEYVRFASDSNMPSRSLLSTNDVDFGHAGGYEFFGGRYFGCGRYAVIANYWTLFADPQMAQYDSMPGVNQRTNVPFTTRSMVDPNVYYGIELPLSNVYSRYDGTFSQRIRRDQDFQNFELNFFSFALGGAARAGVASVAAPCGGCNSGDCGSCGSCESGCGQAASCLRGPTGACAPIYGARCSKLRFAPLAGFRWFRFDDDLEYAASMTDNMYGATADDVYYRNNVTNDLYGFQLGGIATFCTGKRFSLLAGTKAGIFANHINYDSYAGLSDRAATVMSPNSYNGQDYAFSVNDTDLAFIGEGNLGVGICLCKGWTANIGYRIIGIGGLATAPGQIPNDFGLMNDATHINRNDSILLHGLTLGGAYNW